MVAQVDQARVLLQTPLGIAGSARLRYGAAMTLYQAGQISAEVLEVYRSCASLDGQDVQALLAGYGLHSPLAAEAAIGAVLCAIDGYLATLAGPGIADVRKGIAAALETPDCATNAGAEPCFSAAPGDGFASGHTRCARAGGGHSCRVTPSALDHL